MSGGPRAGARAARSGARSCSARRSPRSASSASCSPSRRSQLGLLDARGYNLVLGTAVLSDRPHAGAARRPRSGSSSARARGSSASRRRPRRSGGFSRGRAGGRRRGRTAPARLRPARGRRARQRPRRAGSSSGPSGRGASGASSWTATSAPWTRRRRRARPRCSGTRRAWRSCAGPASRTRACSSIAIGDAITARLAVERARAINPRLTIISRARGRTEAAVAPGPRRHAARGPRDRGRDRARPRVARPDGRLGPGAGGGDRRAPASLLRRAPPRDRHAVRRRTR